MPKEIFDVKEFIALAKNAVECRVKRSGDIVKLKLRTKRYLYTLKTDPKTAEDIVKALDIKVIYL
ncbi:MAG: hypothetical protein ACP6IS_12050 [Candidatus Asgardarchaeia archaeon]